MFESIFKTNSAIRRHEHGPFSKSRKKFIEQFKKNGYSQSTLKKIAWILLSVADQIKVNKGKLSQVDIEKIVEKRKRFNTIRNGRQNSHGAKHKQIFVHFTTEWVRSLGRLKKNPTETCAFAYQIRNFSKFLRNERGLSPITITSQCAHLTSFFATLQTHHTSMRAIKIADIDLFVKMKSDQGYKRSSLSGLVSSLRSFFRYAENKKWCISGISAAIEGPHLYVQENIPESPSWKDVQRLLVSTKGNNPIDIRDHAILLLLSVYGFRRGEVAGMQLDNIDWINEQITLLRPKQRCMQHYPLLPLVGDAILRYLCKVRQQSTDCSLFLSMDAPIRSLSAESITVIAHSRLKKINVNIAPCGAHCLRHACASHLLESGFSLKKIGDYLGHKKFQSTLSYAKIDLVGLNQVGEFELRSLL